MSTLKTNNIQHVDRSDPSIIINTDGSVNIAGTMTYEDVTSVDAVGIITGRDNIDVQKQVLVGTGVSVKAGGLNVTAGITTVQALQATTGTFTGDLTIPDTIVHTGDTDTKIRFPSANKVSVETAGTEKLAILHDEIIINETGGDFNLRIEGDTDTNLFKVDAGTDKIGIGVASPSAKLEVLNDVYVKGSSGDGSVGIQIRSGSSALSNQHQIRTGGGTGQQIFIEALGASSAIVTKTNGTERLRIDNNGKVLIATDTTSEAHANQDELIIGKTTDDANHGLTIVTPDDRYGTVAFSDGSGGTSQGLLEYNHSGDYMRVYTGGGERIRIDSGGLRVNKTTTSDYGRFEVKGPTADDIDTTTDIRTKTVATFSGASPGTTAAGKGMGIVIKPITDRGSHYFFGAANDSSNQEAHGRFIIRSGHLASASVERLRINSSGQVELSQNLLPLVNNTPSIGNGTKNFNSIWASTRFRGNDNVKLVLGNSQDLVVYHDSGINYINSPQGGSLNIKSGTGDNANLRHITCDYNGGTVIYHQQSGSEGERIRTTNDGITFGGEVSFSSGTNVRTFAGTVTLADGQYADIVQNNSGYAWGFFEFYCISYHGSIGRARWHGSMSRYGGNDNYPTINNSMSYTDLQRQPAGSPSGQINMIRIQRTGTYGNVQYNYYVRCYAPNSAVSWTGAGYATLKYSGN